MTQMGLVRAPTKGNQGDSAAFHGKRLLLRNEKLDISWLRDESLQFGDNLPESDEIAALIMTKLQTAMEEIEAMIAKLSGEVVEIEDQVAL